MHSLRKNHRFTIRRTPVIHEPGGTHECVPYEHKPTNSNLKQTPNQGRQHKKEENMNTYFSYKIVVAVAVTVYTLVFSFTALIPVYSSKGEPKNVSAVMWITPIVGIVLITLFSRWAFFVWFWEDPFLMGYFVVK